MIWGGFEEEDRGVDNDSTMNVFGLQEERLGKFSTQTVCVSFRRNRYAKNAVHGRRRGKKVERYIAESLSKSPCRNCKGFIGSSDIEKERDGGGNPER